MTSIDETVWVQVAGVGLRVPEGEGLQVAAELMSRYPDARGFIHDGDCRITLPTGPREAGQLVVTSWESRPVCDCEPFEVVR